LDARRDATPRARCALTGKQAISLRQATHVGVREGAVDDLEIVEATGEVVAGIVRLAGVYRYEPRTQKFEVLLAAWVAGFEKPIEAPIGWRVLDPGEQMMPFRQQLFMRSSGFPTPVVASSPRAAFPVGR
jgi:hypothetical protein